MKTGRLDQIRRASRRPRLSKRPDIRLKRWNDPPSPADGWRLLICRYRPRALPKAQETWDYWLPNLGPSRELHADYYGKFGPPIGWEEYKRRYLREMRGQGALIEEVARRASQGTVTLLCSSHCVDDARCHRSLLAPLVEAAAAALAGSRAPGYTSVDEAPHRRRRRSAPAARRRSGSRARGRHA